MMKRFVSLTILILMTTSLVFAATISSPAATVRLTKTVQISMSDLDAEVAKYQAAAQDPSAVDPLQVLNLLINNELFRQGAERDGVVISSSMVDTAYKNQKAVIEQSYGTQLTNEEFDQIIVNNFGSVAAYKQLIGEQLLVDSYVQLKKSDVLKEDPIVTESEITSFYRKNRTMFVSPETVKLSHIFIPYSSDSGVNTANKTLLSDVADKIKNGTLSFEKAVVEYSQDTPSKSKGGDIGWLTMDNEEARLGLGESFFEVAFSLDVGETSGLVESNTGYHILKVLVYSETKILALDDVISPNNPMTIRTYITNELKAAKQQELYVKAVNSLVDELRKSATVRILYK
ncbi:MAG: peptidylprolyl isomerase [Spirochaetales bacterium]|nr:peptidylprolyl isomerase [Spirochaetales bacterium]